MTERPESPVLDNPGSDRVKSVRALSGRSARRRTGTFLAEGPRAVREAVAAHAAETTTTAEAAGTVRALYLTPQAAERHGSLVLTALDHRIRTLRVTDRVLSAMADTVTPQGMLAVCALRDVPLPTVLAGGPRLVAVLDRVRDPGNAGTVLRAADAAGADAVVLTSSSVDVHNPKCVRSTAGSLFHLPVVTGIDLSHAVEALRGAGLRIHATAGAGDLDLDDLLDDPEAPGGLAGPTAWIFGNEARGLGEADLALADDAVRVPVHGRAESLNLATAATVCLYASARSQRRGTGCRTGRAQNPHGAQP
jgi:RNA methyltransferase, TrmH family